MNKETELRVRLVDHIAEVADCRVARSVLEQPLSRLNHGALRCAPLISAQLLAGVGDADKPQAGTTWLLPEPWNGQLATAPILFIGQNPSANTKEDYPTLLKLERPAAHDELLEFFNGRFGPGKDAPIADGTRVRLAADGSPGPKNPFLGHVLKLATTLLGRPARPGEDYAITEAVRCKAARATGVEQALRTCARHLPSTLQLSGASVVVCLGSLAHRAFEQASKQTELKPGEPFSWEGRKVLFLAHSNARGNAKRKVISNSAVRELHAHLLKAMATAAS